WVGARQHVLSAMPEQEGPVGEIEVAVAVAGDNPNQGVSGVKDHGHFSPAVFERDFENSPLELRTETNRPATMRGDPRVLDARVVHYSGTVLGHRGGPADEVGNGPHENETTPMPVRKTERPLGREEVLDGPLGCSVGVASEGGQRYRHESDKQYSTEVNSDT